MRKMNDMEMKVKRARDAYLAAIAEAIEKQEGLGKDRLTKLREQVTEVRKYEKSRRGVL